jgi:protein-tyrosine phosphatase
MAFSERSLTGGVDEVPLPAAPGRLWLCGKHFVGPDPEAALARVGGSAIVCLTEEHELAERYPAYVVWLRDHAGDRALWWPVPDLHAPDEAVARQWVGDLVTRLGRGEVLLVHCGAGIGRAGTIAAAVLLSLGIDLDEALTTVARSRPMAGPEAGAQRELLERLAGG